MLQAESMLPLSWCCESWGNSEEPVETEGVVQERQQHWTLMLDTQQDDSPALSQRTVLCSLFWAVLAFWGCGPIASRQSCVQQDSLHTVAQSLHGSPAAQLPYPLPTFSTRARQEVLLFNIIPYFKQEHTCNIFKSFVSWKHREARLGWCRSFVGLIKLVYNDYMWLASRVCIAQPPAAALRGCLRKSC